MHHSSARDLGRNQFVRLLEAAARLGRAEVTELLLDAGADPTLVDHNGKTAAQFARERGLYQIAQQIEVAAQ